MKKIIILLGVPGSGKGTQAKRLAARTGYAHISSGNLLRTLESAPGVSSSEREKLQAMKDGKLVSSDFVFEVTAREIAHRLDDGQGVVLDGVSRSLEQAQMYQGFFEGRGAADDVVAIEIALSDEQAVQRLSTRLEYAKQGMAVPGTAVEEVRKDDDPEVVRQRIAEQGNVALSPITGYYASLGQLVRVDGSKSIDEVEADVAKGICLI